MGCRQHMNVGECAARDASPVGWGRAARWMLTLDRNKTTLPRSWMTVNVAFIVGFVSVVPSRMLHLACAGTADMVVPAGVTGVMGYGVSGGRTHR
jgi:hypothetical protein